MAGAGGAQLGQEGLDQQSHGFGDGRVGRERTLGANRFDATVDSSLVAHVALAEEVGERFASGTLSRLKRRPAVEEISKNGSVLVPKPLPALAESRP